MTPEQRLDRAERVLVMLAKAGYRARREWRAESNALNQKINILVNSQIETSEQIRDLAVGQAALAESHKLTEQTLRAFIDSLRKGRNGKSST